MIIQEDEYICHYGVLGMKWGVRKADKKSFSGSVKNGVKKIGTAAKRAGTATANAIRKARVYHAMKSKKRIRGYKHLSDEELASVIKRLEQEKRYKDLTESLGKKGVAYGLKNFGSTMVNTASTKLAQAAGQSIVDSLIKKETSKVSLDNISKVSNDSLKAFNTRRSLEDKARSYLTPDTKKEDTKNENKKEERQDGADSGANDGSDDGSGDKKKKR